MWYPYDIGNINDLREAETPYFEASVTVENITPVFQISNTINEDGEVYTAKGIVTYNGENLVIPFDDTTEKYITRSGNYALRVQDNILQLGVYRD